MKEFALLADQANERILARRKSVTDVQSHYGDELAVLARVVDYSTNLIPRCFLSSERTLTDLVILWGLFKHSIAHLDACHVLLSAGAIPASFVPLRAHFEASLQLAFMLQRDSDRRARAYYVWNLRRERRWARRIIPGTAEKRRYDRDSGVGSKTSSAKARRTARETDREITAIVSERRFRHPEGRFAEFEKKRAHDPSWYQILGIRSVRHLARRLKRRKEYALLYELGSETAHTASYARFLRFESEGARAAPIRRVEMIDTSLGLAIMEGINSSRLVLARYRPEEYPRFVEKYLRQWRKHAQGIRPAVETPADNFRI